MPDRKSFTVNGVGGALGGWVTGEGTPTLLLHGGPGMSFTYLDGLLPELELGYRVASFQQRGLAPSTVEGPFTLEQATVDIVAVLDGLGWSQALLVGHSWGGHLALRFAAAHPDRLLGMLAVDPIGIVGDGGSAAFEAEIGARTPKDARERALALDARAMAGDGTPEEAQESMRLVWPAYFADPGNVPETPREDISIEAYSSLIGVMAEGTEAVAEELAKGVVPYGIVAGGASPIPWGQAAQTSVEISPRAFLDIVPEAGHFVWYEAPGRVRAGLDRLITEVAAASP